MAQRQIVLTGFVGSGKTTIFNLICRTNQPTLYRGTAITKQSVIKQTAYGSGFRVIDTPGYASKQDKMIHAVGLLNALSEGPLNQIFLIVKWDRIEFMEYFLKNMIVKFRRYKHLLSIAVTHWDTADKQTQQENKEQVISLCTGFGINSVIFVSKFDSGLKVCAQIDLILDRSQAEVVQLTETEFYSNFDLVELKNQIEFDLKCKLEDVYKKLIKITSAIKKFIQEFDEKNPLLQEIMHQLILETKNIVVNLISNFNYNNTDQLSQLFEQYSNPTLAYFVLFELKKQLMSEINQILQLIFDKMKTDKNHFFNYIKACPHCGIIWLKVFGPYGETDCGKFPGIEEDSLLKKDKISYRFKFNITQAGVNYTYTSTQENVIQKIRPFYQLKGSIGQKQIEPFGKKGCGHHMVWNEVPLLSDQFLKELIDPGIIDYLNEVNPKEDLKKTLMQAQKSVKDQVEQIKKENRVIKL